VTIPETSSESRAATHRTILEAARTRFARFGPRKTTMEEVAREAGCSRATLYLHFPGKSALYAGLLEHETGGFLAELERALASSQDAAQTLREILAATVRIYSGNPVLGGALLGDEEMALERVASPAVRSYERRVIEILSTVLRDGIREGGFREIDAEAVAYLMYQLGRVLVTREVAGEGEYPLDRALQAMDDLLALGLARREPPG
jgi:AcrR family transcriptional regulator